MKKFIAIICICVASILALTGCSQIFMSKPKKQTIMKVFESGGRCQWDTVLAALEDCVCLGVDEPRRHGCHAR